MTVWQVQENVLILENWIDIFSFVLIQKKQKIKAVENLLKIQISGLKLINSMQRCILCASQTV